MSQEIAIKDPPKVCLFCREKRIGIQEGVVYFKCGTSIKYPQEVKPGDLLPTKRSSECQKQTKAISIG